MKAAALLLCVGLLSGCSVIAAAGGSIAASLATSLAEGIVSELGAKAVDAAAPDVEAELEKIAGKYKGTNR